MGGYVGHDHSPRTVDAHSQHEWTSCSGDVRIDGTIQGSGTLSMGTGGSAELSRMGTQVLV